MPTRKLPPISYMKLLFVDMDVLKGYYRTVVLILRIK